MAARTIKETFTVYHGTEEELKKVKGKTIDKKTAFNMAVNELASRFALDIPDDEKCVLVISYAVERPELIKDKAELKKAALAQRN